MKTLMTYLPCVLPIAYLAVVLNGGGWALILPALILFVGVPVADLIVGEDRSDPDDRPSHSIARSVAAAAPVGFVVLHVSCLVAGVLHSVSGTGVLEIVASVLSLGAIGSIGITAAHELVHKKDLWSKIWGRVALVTVAYLHFEVNHIYGHHRNACTSKDPSTSRYNENLYGFLRRTVPGCFSQSWVLQRRLLHKAGHGTCHIRNVVLWAVLLSISLSLVLVTVLGPAALLVYALSAALAVSLLEAVSYIEHYGLTRERDVDGRVRRMAAHHSWDSYYAVSGAMTFMLQRHAHHHTVATRAYNDLNALDAAPELPCGYPVMVTLALVPPMWRRVMHPRLARLGVGERPVPAPAGSA